MMTVKNFSDLKSVVYDRWFELNEMKSEYLSDAGKAAQEAYRSIYWHCSFHSDLVSLSEDEEFKDLVNIPDKDPEFYRIIRMVNRSIERILKEG